MERNWVKDRDGFEKQLEKMAEDAKEKEGGLDFLLFPEGTIVTVSGRSGNEINRSTLTDRVSKIVSTHRTILEGFLQDSQKRLDVSRYFSTLFPHPKSSKIFLVLYRELMLFVQFAHAVKDFEYTLLPRATGLFFALRQLAVRVPTLQLVDLTIGYPLPRHKPSSKRIPLYPSEYYNLPSIFLQNVPPPELHFHLRTYNLSDIPLGDLSEGGDGTEEEKKVFDEWLLKVWGEKDELLKRFNEKGSFCPTSVSTNMKKNESEEETDEEDDEGRMKGEIGWVPRLRNSGSELATFIGITVLVVGAYGLGIGWAWKSAKEVFGGVAASKENELSGNPMRVGCGCGKKMTSGMGLEPGDRIEL